MAHTAHEVAVGGGDSALPLRHHAHVSAQAAEEIQAGDQVEVDFATGIITDSTQGKTWQAAPFPAFIDGIIQSGGLLNALKERGVAK